MSKKPSSYENLYTKQINEAVFNQTGHESKKAAESKKLQQQNEATKRNLRIFCYLVVAAGLSLCGYLINLDPGYAVPCAIALGVFVVVAGLVFFMNK